MYMRGYAQVTCKCYPILYKALVSAGFLEPVLHGYGGITVLVCMQSLIRKWKNPLYYPNGVKCLLNIMNHYL